MKQFGGIVYCARIIESDASALWIQGPFGESVSELSGGTSYELVVIKKKSSTKY